MEKKDAGINVSDDVYCRYCGQALEREDIYDK